VSDTPANDPGPLARAAEDWRNPDGSLLAIRDLRVTFRSRQSTVTAVDGLSLTVAPGEVLGIVGESGSGKSVSMMSVLGLIRDPNATVTGEALFAGEDLLTMPDKKLRAVRGRRVAMIFQDPMTALTPVYTVGWHIAEQLRAHFPLTRAQARERAIELLDEVGIPNAARRVDAYPHELSGGMRQRAVIAMALACDPVLLIADEPTTALDVTTQAQILDLMRRLRQDHGSAIVLITHDMGVISTIADRVLVMYGGKPVEQGPRRDVFRESRHPYTRGLLRSVPRVSGKKADRLAAIPGAPISLADPPVGCGFGPRCGYRHDACGTSPEMAGGPDHRFACWLPDERRDWAAREAGAA
jgi:peptide/nickel transport system ATP-binding protein